MKKTESTAVKTEDTAKAGTMVVLKTVLEPEKKSEPDKAGKSIAPKSETKPKSATPKSEAAKVEKADPKSTAKPKATKAEKADSKSEAKPEAVKAEKADPKSEAKTKAAKAEKSDPKSEAETKAAKAEKSDPKSEAEPKAAKAEKSDPKSEAEPKAAKAEKSDPKSEVKPEPVKVEKADPKSKTESPAQDAKSESNAGEQVVSPPASENNPSVPNPPAVPEKLAVQVVDSPLKRMKQEFTERANVIKQEMRNIQNSFLVIGFQLHWIKSNNMYKVLNYKNIMDYAEKEFGIKKSTCCNFINIIENYAERDENGEVIESIVECYRNFSSSQLLAMIGMPEEIQQQVTPDMSVRAINRLRKGEPEQPPVDAPKAVISDAEPASSTPINEAPKSATPVSAHEAPKSTASIPVHELPKTVTPVSTHESPKSTGPVPVHKPAEPANNPPVGNSGKSLASHREPAPRTLLEIASYSSYRSAVDKIDKLVKEAFSAGRQMKIKLVCEEG